RAVILKFASYIQSCIVGFDSTVPISVGTQTKFHENVKIKNKTKHFVEMGIKIIFNHTIFFLKSLFVYNTWATTRKKGKFLFVLETMQFISFPSITIYLFRQYKQI